MKKRIILILVGIFAFFLAIILGGIIYYNASLSPVNKDAKENIEFVVSPGEAVNTIISNLEKQKLIKNEFTFKIYTKLNSASFQAGTYILNQKMSAKEIYDALINGKVNFETVWVTFVEGKRLTYIAKQISNSFPYTIDEINQVLEDEDFLRNLIDKYDILTEDILNEKIYHPLEGYLFPDTYEFLKDSTIEQIIEKMVATTDSKVSAYLEDVDEEKFSIHEVMTLASIIEMEGTNSQNRPDIAGVFLNRIKRGETLGSDVTTYYGVGVELSERDLYLSEINDCTNVYNTRCRKGLPVGPIASVSIGSIKAAIYPNEHDYLFFVSDKNGKIYLTKTNAEHVKIVSELKKNGLWFEY